MKTLVVPLDGHGRSESAIPVARALAERCGADIVLMSATKKPDKAHRVAYLTALVDQLGTVTARVDVVVTDRPVAEAVVAIAHLAPEGVVCMRAHGRGPLGSAVIGNIATEVVAATPDSVILIGPNVETERFGAKPVVLIPLDGSEEAETICPLAIEMARDLAVEPALLRVVHSFDDSTGHLGDTGLERAVKIFEDAGLSPTVEVALASKTPVSIVDHARAVGATLIIMNTHLRREFAGTALGEVATAVVHAASCPVLVRHPS